MIVLGLSGLPNSQRRLRETRPDIDPLDARICQGLDSAAAILVDGRLVAAASEERFDGDKGTGALPRHAIAYCLAEAGVRPEDVDVVAHGFDYDRHRRAFVLSRDYFDDVLSSQTVRDALTEAGWPVLAERFRPVEHHRAHALSAVVPSGFSEGLAVVSDGMGEVDSLSVYRFRGAELEKLHSQPIASSLGILYSIGTRFLGFQFNNDEYKVMGLAPYGDPERYREVFRKLTRFDADRGSVVDRLADGRARGRRGRLPAGAGAARGADLHPEDPRRVDPARRGRLRGRHAGVPDRAAGRARRALAGEDRRARPRPGRRHVPQLQVQPVHRRSARPSSGCSCSRRPATTGPRPGRPGPRPPTRARPSR